MKQTIYEQYPQLRTIPADKFPSHVCIIPDGNGRWAQKLQNIVLKGHEKGADVVKQLLRDLGAIEHIKIVTVWGFSADNWKRSAEEVAGLMTLFKKSFEETLLEIQERNGRFIHLGRKDRIPQELLSTINKVEKETAQNTGQIVAIAIDFGGEDQIVRMIEKARALPKEDAITQDTIWQLRDGEGLVKSADLLIRTSGEMRTSDIGWLNGAPTELFVIDKLFPDVTTGDIMEAIVSFAKRDRRMGGRSSLPFISQKSDKNTSK